MESPHVRHIPKLCTAGFQSSDVPCPPPEFPESLPAPWPASSAGTFLSVSVSLSLCLCLSFWVLWFASRHWDFSCASRYYFQHAVPGQRSSPTVTVQVRTHSRADPSPLLSRAAGPADKELPEGRRGFVALGSSSPPLCSLPGSCPPSPAPGRSFPGPSGSSRRRRVTNPAG